MKRISLLTVFALLTAFSFGFEGIVHCTKIENGITTSFDFYVKGDKVALLSKEGGAAYQIILDRKANELFLCMDHPAFQRKGYYHYTSGNFSKSDSLKIYKSQSAPGLEINGMSCNGYTVVTDKGTATAYFGNDQVSITGFSQFFNDPVYEAIDRSGNSNLPVLIVTDTHTIDLTVETKEVDDSFFSIPAGYTEYSISVGEQ